MFDRFNRRLNYLRISVTDRCNLRCVYCMPETGISLLSHDAILSFEEIAEFTRIAVECGIDKVRLTGGEPLVRKGIVTLVSMLKPIEGIRDFSMTTNGQLLAEFARPLKQAGLQRVNVSLNTLDPARYRNIARGGDVNRTLQGIEAAQAAGLTPIKINCVIEHSPDEPDAKDVSAFGNQHGFEVRFIRKMTLETGEFWKVEGGTGGDCHQCNRLRLTADGILKPCLFNDISINVRDYGMREALQKASDLKPEAGSTSTHNRFYRIGG